MSPDVAKKNFIKHCGLELVESLLVGVGHEAVEIEALWESFDAVFHFVESVILLSEIGPLPEIVLFLLPNVVDCRSQRKKFYVIYRTQTITSIQNGQTLKMPMSHEIKINTKLFFSRKIHPKN